MADKNIITLTEGEIMLARTIASFRTGLNRITNVGQPLKISNQDNFTNDLIGICGEMAFAKRMNIYLDFSFNPRSGGSDCKLRNGQTADVKTTSRADGRLVVPSWKEKKPSDYYVLVTGDVPTSSKPAEFIIRGYATAEKIFSNKINLGYGPCFGLPQSKLKLSNEDYRKNHIESKGASGNRPKLCQDRQANEN